MLEGGTWLGYRFQKQAENFFAMIHLAFIERDLLPNAGAIVVGILPEFLMRSPLFA
jgi:hypothetical protein